MVSWAIGTKRPPRVLLYIFRRVNKLIRFEVLLNKLESLGSYQRTLAFEPFESLIEYGKTLVWGSKDTSRTHRQCDGIAGDDGE